MIPRIFEGEPVIIVAGGPSLKGFDFSRLAGKNVIAINRAYQDCPDATMLWWSDCRFWWWHRKGILGHKARHMGTCDVGYANGPKLAPTIQAYRLTGNYGFDDNPKCVRSGNNSSYAAMHTSIHLGASMQILMGVDMRYIDKESHYHGGYEVRHEEAILTDYMLPHFQGLVEPLAERGISVLNASIDSALTLWPRCSIDEGLEAYEKAMALAKDRKCAHASPSPQPLISTPLSL